MLRMLYALAPLAAAGVYFFGWRSLALLGVCAAAGFATEYVTSRRRAAPVSTACFVTIALYALSLPPLTPLWIAAVGAVVAILFGKEVFGGFGRNFANPAIVGRAFVYICFPVALTSQFVPAFTGWPGGLAHWSFAGLDQLPPHLAAGGKTVLDAITQASPQWVVKNVTFEVSNLADLLLGTIGGTYSGPNGTRIVAAGSIGEGCAVLIALAAAYLLITRTANWRLMAGGLLGVVVSGVFFRNVLGFDAVGQVPPIELGLLAGSTLFAIVFMITEPVSAPKKHAAQWVYAFLIGLLMIVMRWLGVFVASATFAILIGNMVAPLLDLAAGTWEARKSAPVASGGDAA